MEQRRLSGARDGARVVTVQKTIPGRAQAARQCRRAAEAHYGATQPRIM